MENNSELESHRSFAIARGEAGEALVQPDTEGVWRYVYEDGELDINSHVDLRNPVIKLEAVSFVAPEQVANDLETTALNDTIGTR